MSQALLACRPMYRAFETEPATAAFRGSRPEAG